ASGMYWQVNMGSAQTFNQIEMDSGGYATDYARGYNVEVSTNGTTFTSVATGTGASSPETVTFATQTAQYIRVVLTQAVSPYWWSMVNFTVYTSGGSSGGDTVTVTGPGSQTSTVGTAARLQISASDSASGQTLAYSATGLPAGLSINASTGLISGTPTTAGTSSVTVTAKDTTGASGSASFSWTVNASTGSGGTLTITASTYAAASSGVATQATSDTSGGNNVGWLGNGSWLEYTGVNFGSGYPQIEARIASAYTGALGTISFRLGSTTATPFATINVNGTGGWQTWATTTPVADSPAPTGSQTLYVTFATSTGTNFVNVNWFELGSLSSTSSTVTVTASTYAASSSGPMTEATSDTGGGDDVGWIGNGAWLEYTRVNFGSGLTG